MRLWQRKKDLGESKFVSQEGEGLADLMGDGWEAHALLEGQAGVWGSTLLYCKGWMSICDEN